MSHILQDRPHVCRDCNYPDNPCAAILMQQYAELEAERDKYRDALREIRQTYTRFKGCDEAGNEIRETRVTYLKVCTSCRDVNCVRIRAAIEQACSDT